MRAWQGPPVLSGLNHVTQYFGIDTFGAFAPAGMPTESKPVPKRDAEPIALNTPPR